MTSLGKCEGTRCTNDAVKRFGPFSNKLCEDCIEFIYACERLGIKS